MDRRSTSARDRRVNSRGGRREGERRKPWYLRRRLWLAAASVMFVGWRRMRAKLDELNGPRLGE
jgi:hypothetical protein